MSEENETTNEPQPPPAAEFYEQGTPEQLAELYGALAAARGEFTKIVKNRTVTIKPKDPNKPAYTFDYAELEESLAATVPALSKHGLVVIQPPTIGVIRTILAHKAGARVTTVMELPRSEDIKTFGANITYLRRYCYNALLCLSADADADDVPLPARGEAHAESRPRSQPQVPPAERREASAAPRPTQPAASARSTESRSGGVAARSASLGSETSGSTTDGPLTEAEQKSLRELLVAAGATTPVDQRALCQDLMTPHNETRIERANYKRLCIELGKLAITAKEQSNG